MPITKLDISDERQLTALCRLSVRAARENSPRWLATLAVAQREIETAVQVGNISAVFEDKGVALGWIAAEPRGQRSWELHPLLVDPSAAGAGIGRQLVAHLEAQVREAGGRSMYLSTSDSTCATTLSGVDLCTDPLLALRGLKLRDPKQGHAFRFWQRVGYSVVGVLPDAEGEGVPSIQLAKKLSTVV